MAVSAGPAVSATEGVHPAAGETKAAPGAQLEHADAPPKLYVLAGHAVQVAAPAPEYVPAAQAAQPVALTVPGDVTVPLKPGAQTVQAETAVLPAAEVETPAGQETQAAALAAPTAGE